MFWGLVLEPGKRYSTTVDKSFHVSMAALDCSSVKPDSEILSVILESDGQENILCNLSKQHKLLQSHLDLNFMTGDKVAFEVKGNGSVHLSGYLVPEDDDDDYMNMPDYDEDDIEEDEEDEETEGPSEKADKGKQKGKRKAEPPLLNDSKKKKIKAAEESDEDSDEEDEGAEDDEDETVVLPADSSDDEEEEEDDDSDEEEDDDSDEEEDEEAGDSDEEEEEVPVLSKKQQKTPQSANKKGQQQTPSNKQTPNSKQQQKSANKQNTTPLVNGSGPNQQLSNKKGKKEKQETPAKTPVSDVKGKNQKTPGSEAGTPQKKKLEGGIIVKDIKEGNGPVAKQGQMVSVYYQGRLKSNNKMFDECKRGGPPFKFRLGKGEVIKGWDIGVSGMKVGSVRSITCPPHMAYGQKGSPPQIPPNSALVFQVELKAVN